MTKTKAKTTPPLPELSELADQIGNFIQYWGFKGVHGRVWTHLYLSEAPLSATDLARRLKVSKALMSLCIADLLEYSVIEQVGKGNRRTVFYRANPNVSVSIVNVLRARERKMMAQILAAFSLLDALSAHEKTLHGVNLAHLRLLGTLIRGADRALASFVTALGGGLDIQKVFVALTAISSAQKTALRKLPGTRLLKRISTSLT